MQKHKRALLDAATGATREHWVTFACRDCGRKERVPVSVPDVRALVAAIELLLREGLGRVAQAEEPPLPRLPETAAAIRQMGWQEMQLLAATLLVDEITACAEGAGRALLRERLEAVSEGTRSVLREALAELAA